MGDATPPEVPKLSENKPALRILRVEHRPPLDTNVHAVAERLLAVPATIHLFTDGPDEHFDVKTFRLYLEQTLGPNFSIVSEGDIWRYALNHDSLKYQAIIGSLAKAKAWAGDPEGIKGYLPIETRKKLEEESLNREPSESPIRSFLLSQSVDASGPHGRKVQRLVPQNEYYNNDSLLQSIQIALPIKLLTSDEHRKQVVLVVTGRGIGEGDRIHMRAGYALGNIAIASTTGIVEGPGEPIEVRKAYAALDAMGSLIIHTDDPKRSKIFFDLLNQGIRSDTALALAYQDKMLHFGDERITDATKGLALQLILFARGELMPGISQCSTSGLSVGMPQPERWTCRLHDAHWQEELIATQIKNPGDPEFCTYHSKLFDLLQTAKPSLQTAT